MDMEGEEEQTSAVEVEVVEITYLVVEEEEDQISGVEMTVTTMETTVVAPLTDNGVITTITMATGETTITTTNGAVIIASRGPQETSEMYRIPSQWSCILKRIPRW